MPVSILRVVAVFRYVKSAICRCDQQRPDLSYASECEIAGDQPTTLTLNTLFFFFFFFFFFFGGGGVLFFVLLLLLFLFYFQQTTFFNYIFLIFPVKGFDISCKLSPDNLR